MIVQEGVTSSRNPKSMNLWVFSFSVRELTVSEARINETQIDFETIYLRNGHNKIL